MATVCVVGTTSWGTTLANIAAQNGHIVNLLSRTKIEAEMTHYEKKLICHKMCHMVFWQLS